jgi:opacity protein-like surface antigen
MDYLLTDRFSLRGEYFYEDGWRRNAVTLANADWSNAHKAQTVRAGIAWHFH